MKLLCLIMLLPLAAFGQAIGDYLMQRKNTAQTTQAQWITPTNTYILGFNGTQLAALSPSTVASAHSHTWASITSKPTTLSGFGITNGVANTITVNGHALSGNVTVTAGDLSLGSVENTAISTWAGTTNVTTLGTITTGTWNGTTLAISNGGTGATSASAARTSLGATTLGANIFTLSNPSAISFIKIAADNTASTRTTTQFKADLSLDGVENTALSTWAGTTNVTTLGTITAGTWNGTTIAVANGGTGATTAANARTALGATTAGSNIFTLTNPGAVSFVQIAADNTASTRTISQLKTDLSLNAVENIQLSTWSGSTNIVTLGTITAGTWNGSAINAATYLTGIVPPANLGTGSSIASKYLRGDGTWQTLGGGSPGILGGDLGATDNAIVRADGTGGLTAQGSAATMDDSGNITAGTFNGLTVGRGASGSAGCTGVGTSALASNASGTTNTALGAFTLTSLATGNANTAVGNSALTALNGGGTNTSVGYFSLGSNVTGGGNVALGYYAGAYETASNSFYVDNQDRTNTSGDKTKALLYGTFATTAASQQLTINAGTVSIPSGSIELGNASDTTLARSSAGNVTIEGNAIYRAGGTDVAVADGGTGVSTLTNHGVVIGQSTSAVAVTSAGNSGEVLTSNGASADPTFQARGNIWFHAPATTSTEATGTTTIPLDNTIPQNTEGTEFMTVTVTPKSASSTLVIEFQGWGCTSVTAHIITALFQDSAANALTTTDVVCDSANYERPLLLRYSMTSGTTSATTFKIRIGPHTASTFSFLKGNGASYFSTAKQATFTVIEILP